MLSVVRQYRAGAVDQPGGAPQPRAAGPHGAVAALFELDIEVTCPWLDVDNEMRQLGQKLRLEHGAALPKRAVLGSLFKRSHIYYLSVATHLKCNFWIALIIPPELSFHSNITQAPVRSIRRSPGAFI